MTDGKGSQHTKQPSTPTLLQKFNPIKPRAARLIEANTKPYMQSPAIMN